MSVETNIEIHEESKQLSVDSIVNWQLPVLVVLFVSVVFVAISTVVHRHESRTAYIKLQQLEKERDKLAAQWSRLKLEQATTLNQVRVEKYARWELNMKMPKASEVKTIQEPEKAEAVVTQRNVDTNIKVSTSDIEATESSKVVLGN